MYSFMNIQVGVQLVCVITFSFINLFQSISPLVMKESNFRLANSFSVVFSIPSSFSMKSLRAAHGSMKHFVWWSHATSWFFILQNMGEHPFAAFGIIRLMCRILYQNSTEMCFFKFASALIVIWQTLHVNRLYSTS